VPPRRARSAALLRLSIVLSLSTLAVGCAATRRLAGPSEAPPEPGRPVVGMASWYGRQHQGRATSSGEAFDMNQLTAAHRTLPFGTRVRVKNLETGRSVVVRVNDRGPFAAARIIDVSYAAAKTLGMVGAGVTRVEMVVLAN